MKLRKSAIFSRVHKTGQRNNQTSVIFISACNSTPTVHGNYKYNFFASGPCPMHATSSWLFFSVVRVLLNFKWKLNDKKGLSNIDHKFICEVCFDPVGHCSQANREKRALTPTGVPLGAKSFVVVKKNTFDLFV